MYNAGSSTLFLALGAHYVCSHALVMLLLIVEMVVAFLSYPFKFQELIRLKINAFLVSFPFMIKKLIRLKFNPFGWVHMMDSSILIFNWFNIYYYI